MQVSLPSAGWYWPEREERFRSRDKLQPKRTCVAFAASDLVGLVVEIPGEASEIIAANTLVKGLSVKLTLCNSCWIADPQMCLQSTG